MPFIPHTEHDVQSMLSELRLPSTDELFSEIPKDLQISGFKQVPDAISEMQLMRLMRERSHQDGYALNFIGAGAYEHHIPAAVWDIVTRGEFMTAYTPYQAEASQGTLQLLYEYQSMMAHLMSMEVSNASLYDGASALAEAVLMAVRIQSKTKAKRVLIARTLNPLYRQVVQSIVSAQGITLQDIPYCPKKGTMLMKGVSHEQVCAVILPQPNFFGQLEAVDEWVEWAAKQKILSIGVVNPLAMALLKPPGEWGSTGVDMVCGEGQPLGIPLASGGPYFGFLCCKKEYIRQLPGRLIGRTQDSQGRIGYTLTLQAREQHIRRSKATSNICTNQGLLVTAATIYMSIMGYAGLRSTALQSHQQAQSLSKMLLNVPGVERVFEGPCFHECVIKINSKIKIEKLLHRLGESGILGGFALETHYPELAQCLLVCATETKTREDLQHFADTMQRSLQQEKSEVLA